MELHNIQIAILMELTFAESFRFSDFTTPENMGIEKDKFNYHLQTLVKIRLIEKDDNARYFLSEQGKAFT